ncbi:hypothetical protein CBS101457_005058 [Exobasidium rhododendri]|nr:hypothetical protein CBS101457_005058 [Exobasidium rhododendri]
MTQHEERAATTSLLTDGASINDKSFDYVIAGGGTSGLAAAYELSKDSSKKVLVIEAGGDPRRNTKVTSYSAYEEAFGDATLDWNINTVPQEFANGKVSPLHAGKGLGGSSNINGGVFSVPPSSQFDAFSQLGNTGWSWSSFLPFLKSFQTYHLPTADQIAAGITYIADSHANIGQVDVGYPPPRDAQDAAFSGALTSLFNVSYGGDLGSGLAQGSAFLAKFCLPSQFNTRVSAASAYYTPVETSRNNLFILINHQATRIIWSQDGSGLKKTASGVEYQNKEDGPLYKVNAKQVIIAAGTLRSPMLLELSGVGDSSVLRTIGVQQVINLPGVGTNLIEQTKSQVHGGVPKSGTLSPSHTSNLIGLLTLDQLAGDEANMTRQTTEAQMEGWARAAVQSGASSNKDGLLLQYRTMVEGLYEQKWPAAEFYNLPYSGGSIIEAWPLITFSRGSTHATANSVWAPLKVDPRYFSAQIDMNAQVAIMRGARRAFQEKQMTDVIQGPETRPGFDASSGGIPQGVHYGRFDRWQEYILQTYDSVWHLAGTCAMMPESLGGVVGPDFKVHQTSNVWVIDASVIPMPLATHYTSVVYAMANRAASVIKSV